MWGWFRRNLWEKQESVEEEWDLDSCRMAHLGKNLPANARDAKDLSSHSWIRKIPWRRKWHPTLLFLPGESHGQRGLEGCSSWVRKELNLTEPALPHVSLIRALFPRHEIDTR